MSFDHAVQEVVDNVPGAMAGLLMGTDGIPLASYKRPDANGIEVEIVGVEYANLLNEVKRAADILESGGLNEVSVASDKYTLVLRPVTADYFLALAIGPRGNVGKGRFLLRLSANKLYPEL